MTLICGQQPMSKLGRPRRFRFDKPNDYIERNPIGNAVEVVHDIRDTRSVDKRLHFSCIHFHSPVMSQDGSGCDGRLTGRPLIALPVSHRVLTATESGLRDLRVERAKRVERPKAPTPALLAASNKSIRRQNTCCWRDRVRLDKPCLRRLQFRNTSHRTRFDPLINNRQQYKREQSRGKQTADHDLCQRSLRFSAHAGRQHERDDGQDCRKCGHQDRTQPQLATSAHGFR